MTEAVPVRATGREARAYRKVVRRRVSAETRRFGLGERRVHLVEGVPAVVLADQARRTRAQLVVMGAVSRSALKRLFIGSTAERAIDEVAADICIVKPAGFRSTVPAHARHLPVMIPPL